ncbi:hypothetical protein Tco_0736737 [Tanacetum coccineum]
MHNMRMTIAKLHARLKLHDKGISKKAETPAVLVIREGKIQKDKRKPRWAKGKDKGKNKLAFAPKPKILPPPKRDNPTKDSICHHCKEVGYWRRNYLSYQAELKKRKEDNMASTSGIFTIEVYAFLNKTWCMSTLSTTSNIFSPLRDPESLIRGRNFGEPSSLFDFEEVMGIPHNNQGQPPASPPPPDNNGSPPVV